MHWFIMHWFPSYGCGNQNSSDFCKGEFDWIDFICIVGEKKLDAVVGADSIILNNKGTRRCIHHTAYKWCLAFICIHCFLFYVVFLSFNCITVLSYSNHKFDHQKMFVYMWIIKHIILFFKNTPYMFMFLNRVSSGRINFK